MSDENKPKATIEELDDFEKGMRRLAPLFIVQGVVALLAGIVLLFWPTTGLAVASIALGIFLVVEGVGRLTSVLRTPRESGRADILAVGGALLRIMFGALVLFHPVDVGKAGAAVVFILAGANLIVGSTLSFWKDPETRQKPHAAAAAIAMFAVGLLLVLMPVLSGLFFLRLLGGVLVLGSVSPLAVGLRNR